MHLLWLTRKYPDPADSGDLLYSSGMIRSTAEAGAAITVFCRGDRDTDFTDAIPVRWHTVSPAEPRRPLSALTSSLPSDACRLKSGSAQQALRKLCGQISPDAAVIDHAAMAWALPELKRKGIPVVYVSHNYEQETRRMIARRAEIGPVAKGLLNFDAARYALLESELIKASSLISAITEDDLEAFREIASDTPCILLKPGFETKPLHVDLRKAERRVLLVGSFQWIAKRISLRRALEQSLEIYQHAGIQFHVVGKSSASFAAEIKDKFPSVHFSPNVPDVAPFLSEARIGLLLDELGGGFKLKALDYTFRKLPVAGLTETMPGLPLRRWQEAFIEPNVCRLAETIVENIDDLDLLEAMADRALERCQHEFNWQDRGELLVQNIREKVIHPGRNSSRSAPLEPAFLGS